MNIKTIISNMLAHFHPVGLTKSLTPHQQQSVLDIHTPAQGQNPWENAHLVEVTADDFA